MIEYRVAVQAVDPLIRAGVESKLTENPGVRITTPDELHVGGADERGVLVHVETGVLDRSSLLLRAHRPAPRPTIVLAGRLEPTALPSLSERQVLGIYPLQSVGTTRLPAIVHEAATWSGGLVPVDRLRAKWLAETGTSAGDVLSARERNLLSLLSHGKTTEEIATAMHLSERSVKNVVSKVCTRLQLRNRTHAVAYALRTGRM